MDSKNIVSGGSPSGMGNGGSHDRPPAENTVVDAVVGVTPPPSTPVPPPSPAPEPENPVAVDEGVVVIEIQDSPPLQMVEPDSPEGARETVVVEPEAEGVPEDVEPVEEADPVVDGGAEIDPPPVPHPQGGEFVCDQCGATYLTEKAMFGHLRCHKDRTWRGAFSPPTFTIEEFAEYQQHLVKSEEEQLREIEAEETALVLQRPGSSNAPPPPPPPTKEVGESSRRPKVALDLDLNVEVEEEAAAVEEFVVPDLNLPPPNDDEQE